MTPRPRGTYLFASEYFAEEVRRNLIDMYGSEKLYEGGLSVRTTLDPKLQRLARKALQDGLVQLDQARGYRGPVTTIDISGDWGKPLGEVEGALRRAGMAARGGAFGRGGRRPDRPAARHAAGRVVVSDARDRDAAAERDEMGEAARQRLGGQCRRRDLSWRRWPARPATWKLRQPPEIQGALVAMDPYTGRVLAMQGGFSFAQSEFNRATQA